MKARTALLALFCTLVPAGKRPLQSVNLLDDTGQKKSFSFQGKITVAVFLSTVCPISNEYNGRMSALYRDFSPRGVQFLFVNSNVNETAAEVREHATAAAFPFPVFRDIHNGLANALEASVTPEAFLVDATGAMRYMGPIDDARNPARVKAHYLREGIEALLAGKPVPRSTGKAFGCTIKRERKAS